ncbi:MAG: hypothetical protein GC205_07660 [Bacteroidetes bacterium]|nr:hypothetical protein [Bacteroidota bacterium]
MKLAHQFAAITNPPLRLPRVFAGSMLVAFLLMLAACETETLPEQPRYEQYFPLESGRVWEYQLDSILYRETVPNDTQRWFIRQELGQEYTDLEGRPSFPVLTYRRRSAADAWRYHQTGIARIWQNRAEWVENNLRSIKLVFPVQESSDWQGHLFFSDLENIPTVEACNNLAYLYDWTYAYQDLHLPTTLGALSFDSTLTVNQIGEQNLIEYNAASERYATGVGLVWRKFEHLTTQTICPECPWAEKAECGYSVEQQLIRWE